MFSLQNCPRIEILKQIKEFDDNGWAVIHHMVAADKPLLNQVRIFCDADKNLLDLQTRDQYKYTPLLLARFKKFHQNFKKKSLSDESVAI